MPSCALSLKPCFLLRFTTFYCCFVFYKKNTHKQNNLHVLFRTVSRGSRVLQGQFSEGSEKVQRRLENVGEAQRRLEKLREGWTRSEKVGEGQRRLEKVKEGQRRLEKVGESMRKYETV